MMMSTLSLSPILGRRMQLGYFGQIANAGCVHKLAYRVYCTTACAMRELVDNARFSSSNVGLQDYTTYSRVVRYKDGSKTGIAR